MPQLEMTSDFTFKLVAELPVHGCYPLEDIGPAPDGMPCELRSPDIFLADNLDGMSKKIFPDQTSDGCVAKIDSRMAGNGRLLAFPEGGGKTFEVIDIRGKINYPPGVTMESCEFYLVTNEDMTFFRWLLRVPEGRVYREVEEPVQ